MKKIICWSLAVVITISAAVYQRITGPTYPKRAEVVTNGRASNVKLVRSLSLDEPPVVRLAIDDEGVSARLYYKRYKIDEPYLWSDFVTESGKGLTAMIPQQAPAGKLQYWIEITDNEGTQSLFRDEPVIIRFKGAVPGWILTPHVILMFFAMLLSTLTGLMALIGLKEQKMYGVITFLFLMAGGIILGPIVQYYAFGEFWTGVPNGWDLTDNKTLVAFLFWMLAIAMNYKKQRPVYSVAAAVILLIIYSIPHSLFGSELDYETGTVRQGMIINPFLFFV